ncbi:MAG: LacI family DNA-binding transcriptional regulator [Burkholderiales bacterium]|nr:LacI family DNA-binding transcriptional regulator [Burkholderiales bacterium]
MNSKAPTRRSPRATQPKAGSPVTIEMVASLAGVSPSTISRVLNGTAAVSEEKTTAIQAAIAKLGYVPNPLARGLAGGRTLSVGVVTQAVDSPYYGAALRGIEEELDPAGYRPLFVSGNWNAAAEARCIEMLRARRVDGIIVLTGRLPDQALKLCAKTVPVVVTGRTLKAPGLYALKFDNLEGARLATQHLLQLGHRHIGFITGDPDHPDSQERLQGYRMALEAAGVAYDPKRVVPGEYHEVSGLLAVDRLLQSGQPLTAIFAANDQMAFGVALGLRRRGLRVPDDVSLVGFDDLPTAQYASPPLSTIHQASHELGRIAAGCMLQLLSGVEPSAELPAPRFVVRESTRKLGG